MSCQVLSTVSNGLSVPYLCSRTHVWVNFAGTRDDLVAAGRAPAYMVHHRIDPASAYAKWMGKLGTG